MGHGPGRITDADSLLFRLALSAGVDAYRKGSKHQKDHKTNIETHDFTPIGALSKVVARRSQSITRQTGWSNFAKNVAAFGKPFD
jgi:hypothetical protein